MTTVPSLALNNVDNLLRFGASLRGEETTHVWTPRNPFEAEAMLRNTNQENSTPAVVFYDPATWHKEYQLLTRNVLQKDNYVNVYLNSRAVQLRGKIKMACCVRKKPRLAALKQAVKHNFANSSYELWDTPRQSGTQKRDRKRLDVDVPHPTLWAVNSVRDSEIFVFDVLTGAPIIAYKDCKLNVGITALSHAPFMGFIDKQLHVVPVGHPLDLLALKESQLIETDYVWIGFADGSVRLFPAHNRYFMEKEGSDTVSTVSKHEPANIVFEIPKYHAGAIIGISRSPSLEDHEAVEWPNVTRLSNAMSRIRAASAAAAGDAATREHLSLVCTASVDSVVVVWDIKKIYQTLQEFREAQKKERRKSCISSSTLYAHDVVTVECISKGKGVGRKTKLMCLLVKCRPLLRLKGGVTGLTCLRWISSLITSEGYKREREPDQLTRDPVEHSAPESVKSRREVQVATRFERREEQRRALDLSEEEMCDVEKELRIMMPPLALEKPQSLRVNLLFGGDNVGTVHMWNLDEELARHPTEEVQSISGLQAQVVHDVTKQPISSTVQTAAVHSTGGFKSLHKADASPSGYVSPSPPAAHKGHGPARSDPIHIPPVNLSRIEYRSAKSSPRQATPRLSKLELLAAGRKGDVPRKVHVVGTTPRQKVSHRRRTDAYAPRGTNEVSSSPRPRVEQAPTTARRGAASAAKWVSEAKTPLKTPHQTHSSDKLKLSVTKTPGRPSTGRFSSEDCSPSPRKIPDTAESATTLTALCRPTTSRREPTVTTTRSSMPIVASPSKQNVPKPSVTPKASRSRAHPGGTTSSPASTANELLSRTSKCRIEFTGGVAVTGMDTQLPPKIVVTMRRLPDPVERERSLLEDLIPEEVEKRVLENSFDELTEEKALFFVFQRLQLYLSVEGAILNFRFEPKWTAKDIDGRTLFQKRDYSVVKKHAKHDEEVPLSSSLVLPSFTLQIKKLVLDAHSQPVCSLLLDRQRQLLWAGRNDGLLSLFSTESKFIVSRVPHPSATQALGPPDPAEWTAQLQQYLQDSNFMRSTRRLQRHKESADYASARFSGFVPFCRTVQQCFVLITQARRSGFGTLETKVHCLDGRSNLCVSDRRHERHMSVFVNYLKMCRHNANSVRKAQREFFLLEEADLTKSHLSSSDETVEGAFASLHCLAESFHLWMEHNKVFHFEHLSRRQLRRRREQRSKAAGVLLSSQTRLKLFLHFMKWRRWCSLQRIDFGYRCLSITVRMLQKRLRRPTGRMMERLYVLTAQKNIFCQWKQLALDKRREKSLVVPKALPNSRSRSRRSSSVRTDTFVPHTSPSMDAEEEWFIDCVVALHDSRFSIMNFSDMDSCISSLEEGWLPSLQSAEEAADSDDPERRRIAVLSYGLIPLIQGFLSSTDNILESLQDKSVRDDVISMIYGMLMCIDYIVGDPHESLFRVLTSQQETGREHPTLTLAKPEDSYLMHSEVAMRAVLHHYIDSAEMDDEVASSVNEIIKEKENFVNLLAFIRADSKKSGLVL